MRFDKVRYCWESVLLSQIDPLTEIFPPHLTTNMWGSGGGGPEQLLSQMGWGCGKTLPGAGSPIFHVCGPQECGLPCWRAALGEAPWGRVPSPCHLRHSVALDFHSLYFISFFWGFHNHLLSFIEEEEMIGERFLPLNAVKPPWWGECRVLLSLGRAVLTLQHAGAALQILKENWINSGKHKNPKGFTSASETNYRV